MEPINQKRSVQKKRHLRVVKVSLNNPEPHGTPDTEINQFFLDCCPMNQHGYDYLNGYFISDEMAMSLRVGFMEDPKHTFDLLRKSFGLDRLKSAGFLDNDGHFVFWNHQIIFPYIKSGKPVFIQARTIQDYVPREVTLDAPNSWIYNGDSLYFLEPGSTVYVTTGPMETLEMLETRLTLKTVPSFGVVGVHNYSPASHDQLKPYRVVVC